MVRAARVYDTPIVELAYRRVASRLFVLGVKGQDQYLRKAATRARDPGFESREASPRRWRVGVYAERGDHDSGWRFFAIEECVDSGRAARPDRVSRLCGKVGRSERAAGDLDPNESRCITLSLDAPGPANVYLDPVGRRTELGRPPDPLPPCHFATLRGAGAGDDSP